jgi:hypothetical protein
VRFNIYKLKLKPQGSDERTKKEVQVMCHFHCEGKTGNQDQHTT